MSGFSAEWLALREPADAAARSSALVAWLVEASAGRTRHGRLIDLGGGTGANIRYLSPRLPAPQTWTLVDHDPVLLSLAPAGVTAVCADLNAVVEDEAIFRGSALVTASALLDLVSEHWLATLVERCRENRAAVLFALSYDGGIACTPTDPDDELVRRLVNEHQHRDKGLGRALGPDASSRAVALLRAAGYDVVTARSDWALGDDERELQRQLVDGWADAATETAPDRRGMLDAWRSRRRAHCDAGRSQMVVGHVDVAGVLDAGPERPGPRT